MTSDYSFNTGVKKKFGTVDYVLFSLLFCASAVIGFYHAYTDRKNKSARDFHLGGRRMHPIPVALSLSVTFLSALTLLGAPAEIYTNGTMYYWTVLGMFIAMAGTAHVFVPIFYNLETTSCFQYIERRFGTATKLIASSIFILTTLVYMGFVLYLPALAFQAVTGISLWGCMIGGAAVCTLYTTLGGMKTVLWTDSLQFFIIVIGLIAVLIEGFGAVGGFNKAWEIANKNGRIEFDNFSADPRTRHSVWTVGIGGAFFWMFLYGTNQAQIQRACSLPTLRRAQVAVWLNFIGLLLIMTLTCLVGVVMYVFYQSCDPVKFKMVSRPDQLVPLFVMDILSEPLIFGRLPGFPGLFIACVFSGGLSTMSSGLNAISAVLLEDLIKPISLSCRKTKFIDQHEILFSKFLVLIAGTVQFGMAVLVSKASDLILQFAISLTSIVAGPMFGLFVAGMMFPWTNTLGANMGFFTSLAFMCWLGIGTFVEKPKGLTDPLPVSTLGCNWTASAFSSTTGTTTTTTLSSLVTSTTEESLLHDFYRVSYMWYTGLGMIMCVFVAVISSLVINLFRSPPEVESKLMCPLFDVLFPCLPERIRKPLRFGVVYETTDEKDEEKGSETRATKF